MMERVSKSDADFGAVIEKIRRGAKELLAVTADEQAQFQGQENAIAMALDVSCRVWERLQEQRFQQQMLELHSQAPPVHAGRDPVAGR